MMYLVAMWRDELCDDSGVKVWRCNITASNVPRVWDEIAKLREAAGSEYGKAVPEVHLVMDTNLPRVIRDMLDIIGEQPIDMDAVLSTIRAMMPSHSIV